MYVTDQLKIVWKGCIIAFFALTLMIISPTNLPFAAGGDNSGDQQSAISNIMCNAVNQLTGTIGRSIAILIIVSLAISLFLGKVSWGMAIAVAVGMGILFGAKDVVNLLSGATACKGS